MIPAMLVSHLPLESHSGTVGHPAGNVLGIYEEPNASIGMAFTSAQL
jgi:hypothetical protein